MGGVVGLDFTAVLQMADAQGVDLSLTAEVLPLVEPYVIYAWRPEEP